MVAQISMNDIVNIIIMKFLLDFNQPTNVKISKITNKSAET
jgi:hypothetical protein